MLYASSLHNDKKELSISRRNFCRFKRYHLTFQQIYLSLSHIERFLFKTIIQDIPKWISEDTVKNSYINIISLNDCYNTSLTLKEQLTENQKDILYEIVMMSKQSDKINIAASNAITLLNHDGCQFINKNMESIKIPNADLSGSFFFRSNIQNSNLQGVNFSQSSLLYSNFKGCSINFQPIFPFINDTAQILSFSFSPCLKLLVTGNAHGKITIWDAKNRNKIKEVSYMNSRAKSLSYLPDGNLIIANLDNKKIALINAETSGIKFLYYSKNADNRTEFVISPNKELLAIWDGGFECSDSIMTIILNIKTLETVKELRQVHMIGSKKLFAFSPCNQFITYSFKHFISVQHISTGNLNLTMSLGETINAIAFSPIERYTIALGIANGKIELLKLNSGWGHQIISIAKHYTSIDELIFTNNGKFLISLTDSAKISIYDQFERTLVWEFPKISVYDKFIGLYAINDGIACASNNSILIWKVGHKPKNFEGHRKAVTKVVTSPRGDVIASAGLGRKIKLWDTKSMKLIWEFRSRNKINTSLAFSHCGRYLASACSHIQIWSIDSLKELNYFLLWLGTAHSMSFSSDNRSLIVGGYKRLIHIIDCKTGGIIHKLKGGRPEVKVVAVSLDGKYIAVGKDCYYIELWYKENEEWKNKRLIGKQKFTCSVMFSNSARYLLSGCSSGITYIWDVEKGVAIKTFISNKTPIFLAIFSPCEKFIVCCEENGKIVFWNKDLEKIEHIIVGHDGLVTSACFSTCGEFLFTSGNDGSIKKWNIKSYLSREDTQQSYEIPNINLVWSSVNGNLTSHASKIKVKDWH